MFIFIRLYAAIFKRLTHKLYDDMEYDSDKFQNLKKNQQFNQI